MSTLAQIKKENPIAPTWKGVGNLTARTFKTVVLNPFNLGFSIAMPAFMYLMFGAGQEYGQYSLPGGNVAATVLVSMSLLGVMLGTASFGAAVSLERVQGISRLYATTPLRSSMQIAARLLANVGVGAVILAAVYLVGALTGAKMDPLVWFTTAGLILLMSLLSSAIGFGCGFAIRSDASFAATSAIIVLSAFGAGMTIPLDQMADIFQKIAPWTPLWGAGQLVNIPLVGTNQLSPNMIISVVAWTAVFSAMAIWGLRRDTKR